MTLQISDYFLGTTLVVSRPQVSGGGISAPVEVLVGVKCSYVFPHDTDMDISEVISTFRAQWTIFTERAGIRIGDVLVVGSDDEEYEVERVNIWGTHYLECRLLQQVGS